MRALVLSNMRPDRANPGRGSFVRDQVRALRARGGPELELELFEFEPRGYAAAARALHRRRREPAFEIVHAHFGLTGWPALALHAHARVLTLHGTDVRHPRTRLLTAAVLPWIDLVAAASDDLAADVPRVPGRGRVAVLPCGVATDRFRPIDRRAARSELGLEPDGRLLLFGADPARAAKRHDRALAVARECDAQLVTLGGVDAQRVPLLVNAADAVLVPSEREGFGLAVLEALACDVPVLATPTGIHQLALTGVEGTLCAPFDLRAWSALARTHLDAADPRIAGRRRADQWSAERMADRVLGAWRRLLSAKGR